MTNYANNVPATTLDGGVNDSTTSWTVADGTGYPATPFNAKCETEIVRVTAKGGTNDVNWTVTRGYDGSTAAAHSTGATVTDAVIRADLQPLGNRLTDYQYGTYDDEFDDGSIAGAWTAVDLSGNEVTWSEGYNVLSVQGVLSDTGGYFHALLKSGGSIATGTIIETYMRFHAFHSQYPQAGLLFTDGTTENAGNQSLFGVHMYYGSVQANNRDNFRSRASFTDGPYIYPNPAQGIFLRWKYTAANTYDGYVSVDGNFWTQVFTSFSSSFTPTHFGVWIENWGTTSYKLQASFAYFRVT